MNNYILCLTLTFNNRDSNQRFHWSFQSDAHSTDDSEETECLMRR